MTVEFGGIESATGYDRAIPIISDQPYFRPTNLSMPYVDEVIGK